MLKTVERYKYVRQMGRGRGVRIDRKGGVGCEGGQMGRNGGCDADSWGGVGWGCEGGQMGRGGGVRESYDV